VLPHRKFQALVISMPMCIEAVLADRGGPTLCWSFLYFGSYLLAAGYRENGATGYFIVFKRFTNPIHILWESLLLGFSLIDINE
jgi:hypothetical protein